MKFVKLFAVVSLVISASVIFGAAKPDAVLKKLTAPHGTLKIKGRSCLERCNTIGIATQSWSIKQACWEGGTYRVSGAIGVVAVGSEISKRVAEMIAVQYPIRMKRGLRVADSRFDCPPDICHEYLSDIIDELNIEVVTSLTPTLSAREKIEKIAVLIACSGRMKGKEFKDVSFGQAANTQGEASLIPNIELHSMSVLSSSGSKNISFIFDEGASGFNVGLSWHDACGSTEGGCRRGSSFRELYAAGVESVRRDLE